MIEVTKERVEDGLRVAWTDPIDYSRHEVTWSLDELAAMQHGLPIVGTYGELTDERLYKSGALELVARGDLNAFSQAAAVLAQDPARRATLGTAAAVLYRCEFDWPVIADRMHKRLGSIGAAHPGAGDLGC